MAERQFPGASFAFGTADQLQIGAVGRLGYEPHWPEVTPSTLYDLASLTKVFATTTVAKSLVDDAALGLGDLVCSHLPGFRHREVTIEHLLRHESGLSPYMEPADEPVLTRLLRLPLDSAPGARAQYSCLGFIVLQHVCEAAGGAPFGALFEDRVRRPLGLEVASFRGVTGTCEAAAPTVAPESWRNLEAEWLQGVVHDPLAFQQGGTSGNSGLFSDVTSLATACRAILNDSGWASWARREPGHDRSLGWYLKTLDPGSCGQNWSPDSFGHTGFTGTSVWFDPERRVFALLLANAIHPSGHADLAQVRSHFCDIALRAVLRDS